MTAMSPAWTPASTSAWMCKVTRRTSPGEERGQCSVRALLCSLCYCAVGETLSACCEQTLCWAKGRGHPRSGQMTKERVSRLADELHRTWVLQA